MLSLLTSNCALKRKWGRLHKLALPRRAIKRHYSERGGKFAGAAALEDIPPCLPLPYTPFQIHSIEVFHPLPVWRDSLPPQMGWKTK